MSSRVFTVTNSTYQKTVQTGASNLAKQSAKLEYEQKVSQYASQLKQLAVAYEQNQLNIEGAKLQATQAYAGGVQEAQAQRLNAANSFLSSMQNALQVQAGTATQNTQELQGQTQQAKQVAQELGKVKQQIADGEATDSTAGRNQQLATLQQAADLVQQTTQSATQTQGQATDNTKYTSTISSLLSLLASNQKASDLNAANTNQALSTNSYNANVANISKTQQLNSTAYQDTVNQTKATQQASQAKYLADLANLSRLGSSSSRSKITVTNAPGYNPNAPKQIVPSTYVSGGAQTVTTGGGYYLNGQQVSEQQYLAPRKGTN